MFLETAEGRRHTALASQGEGALVSVSHSVDSLAVSNAHIPRKRKVTSGPTAPSYKGFNKTTTRFKTSLAPAAGKAVLSHANSGRESDSIVHGHVVNDSQAIAKSRDAELRCHVKSSVDKRKGTVRKMHSGNEGKQKKPTLITPASWRQEQTLVTKLLGQERRGKKRKGGDVANYSPPTRDKFCGDRETRARDEQRVRDVYVYNYIGDTSHVEY